ncbi:MAG: hypothetical protein JOZ31_23080 [Verrucomicrobia bacterium]|nr:hypothetical protein [Verrucomicrobiota bacterium]MBV8484184.1 hypothetical protein [Verrucomicrobiota bacterium]
MNLGTFFYRAVLVGEMTGWRAAVEGPVISAWTFNYIARNKLPILRL